MSENNALHRVLSSSDELSGVIQPLLTDLYQITMAYAYWKSSKKDERAAFELFFRKNPFKGEFTIFAGLSDCLKLLKNYKFSESDIDYLRREFPDSTEPEFFEYLKELDASEVTVMAMHEGTVVFPRQPLLRIEGPLPIVQLLETPFLTLVNYASLVTTNAARFRMAAGKNKTLLEFGLRRAQGPDGGLSASKYCYIGGFDATSNSLAGKLFDIPVKGTHAHAFVTAFVSMNDLKFRTLQPLDRSQPEADFVSLCEDYLRKLDTLFAGHSDQHNQGELAAFISYATAFPTNFIALVDTYNTIMSGVPNFCAVSLALNQLGYRAKGIRLDSGDLAYLSIAVRQYFRRVAEEFKVPWFSEITIVASNDINEVTLHSLSQQGHEIDAYGIGTHLVTCQKQPALGCVYKLVEVAGTPRIKISQDMEKITIPGKKKIYRLYGKDGLALVDLMQKEEEGPPPLDQRVLCRHPFEESKRAYVQPCQVQQLLHLYWSGGKICQPEKSLAAIRDQVQKSLDQIRGDHKRALNPTPYKVSVSGKLYQFMHDLWLDNAPIGELF